MTSRPRAISVGVLDDQLRSLQRRALVEAQQSYINELRQARLSTLAHPTPQLAWAFDKPGTRGSSAVNDHFQN